ncbi:DUF89 family protein [candidate division KSB1 bacterium]|nr:DUF89 family protein [candidate division KSB1 bacterium]
MHITLDCIPCIVNSFVRLVNNGLLPEEKKEPAMRSVLTFLAQADYRKSPPALGREMHRVIRSALNDPDPYKDIKEKYNKMMLDRFPEFRDMVNNAEDPFDTALRLAMAGNVIDFGPQNQLNIKDTIDRVVHADLAIDDSPSLRRDLQRAQSVLYVGDNCGEIVLDKLFIETIGHPDMTFAVRDTPVLNDATLEDAYMIGMDKHALLITTGDDAPGAVWETALQSFKDKLQSVDVVLAKGQGNLEGLIEIEAPIYYILVVKCPLIGNRLGVETGDFVVSLSPKWKKTQTGIS